MRKVLPIILVIVAAVAAGTYVGYYIRKRQQPTISGPALVVSFLDAHLGGGVVVKTPEGGFAVIDPGPRASAEEVSSYLKSRGARSIDVLITNPSGDRAGALQTLVERFRVRRLFRGEAEGSGRTWREALEVCKKAGVREVRLARGSRDRLSRTVKLVALSPPKGLLSRTGSDRDNNSLVIRLSLGRKTFLLMSDTRVAAEADLLQSGIDLKSSVLAVARRGRSGSTSLELVRAVRPEVCVISADARGRPGSAVLARISSRNTGAELRRTDTDGTVDITTDGRSME